MALTADPAPAVHTTPALDPPSAPRREHRLLVLFGTFGRRTSSSLAEALGGVELTGNAPVLVLSDLALRGPLRPRDIQVVTGLTSGGMTKQLDRLEELGLIERSFGRVRGDRRAILISLTPAGREIADRMADVLGQHLDEARAFLGELRDLLEAGDPGGTPA